MYEMFYSKSKLADCLNIYLVNPVIIGMENTELSIRIWIL